MNTGVGSLSLLQGIFLTQELNQGLLNCRHILFQLSYQGSPNLWLSDLKACTLSTGHCFLSQLTLSLWPYRCCEETVSLTFSPLPMAYAVQYCLLS